MCFIFVCVRMALISVLLNAFIDKFLYRIFSLTFRCYVCNLCIKHNAKWTDLLAHRWLAFDLIFFSWNLCGRLFDVVWLFTKRFRIELKILKYKTSVCSKYRVWILKWKLRQWDTHHIYPRDPCANTISISILCDYSSSIHLKQQFGSTSIA